MRNIFAVFLLFLAATALHSQELNCKVQVNSSMIQGTNKQVFNTLEKQLNELMNTRKWTNAVYANNERIECNFLITVKAYASDYFTAELQVQSRRPIFNSSYFSTLFNFRDQNFNFNYIESQSLETNDRQFTSNLIAGLYFYAYIILGYDGDSFARFGGTPYFQRAEAIATAMQSSAEAGWKAFENDRNRYALITGILDQALSPLRALYYEYYRLGLDAMSSNPDQGRSKIASALTLLKDANQARPSNIATTSFLETSIDEIAEVFSVGDTKERTDVYNLLMSVAPNMSGRFEKIRAQ